MLDGDAVPGVLGKDAYSFATAPPDGSAACTGLHRARRVRAVASVPLVVSLLMLSPCLFAYPTQSPDAATTEYARAIKHADSALSHKHYERARAILSGLHKRYPGNQEVLSLMAKSACARGQYARAERLYSRIPADQMQPALVKAVSGCHSREGLDRAKKALDSGHLREAVTLSRPLFRSNYDAYASGLILGRAYLGQHDYPRAKEIYGELAARYPNDHELRTLARKARTQTLLDAARNRLRTGAATSAIKIAAPLYRRGRDPYGSGLILAQAYMHLGEFDKAETVYQQLRRQYPQDKELAVQSGRLRDMVAIRDARLQLSGGHAMGAIKDVQPVYEDPRAAYRYDAGLLLAKAYLARGDSGHALAVYRALLHTHANDPALKRKTADLEIKTAIRRANALRAGNDYGKAIKLLSAYYDPSSPRYDVGMALAATLEQARHFNRAASVYAALARTYPADSELAGLRLRALLAARRYPEASRIYQTMPPDERARLRKDLLDQARRLYLYSVSVGGEFVHDSNGFPNEHLYEVRLKAVTRAGTFVGHYQRESRFGSTADNYRLDYYYALSHGWYGYLSYAHSPQHTFLADNDYTFAINKAVGPVTLMGSYRHLVFSSSSADVYFGGAGIYPASNVYLVTGAFYVPQTSGYSILIHPTWYLRNGALYAYLTAGQIGEQLNVNGAVLRTPSYSLELGRRLDITPRFSLSLAAFYEHRTGLYNRTGLSLYLTWRW